MVILGAGPGLLRLKCWTKGRCHEMLPMVEWRPANTFQNVLSALGQDVKNGTS